MSSALLPALWALWLGVRFEWTEAPLEGRHELSQGASGVFQGLEDHFQGARHSAPQVAGPAMSAPGGRGRSTHGASPWSGRGGQCLGASAFSRRSASSTARTDAAYHLAPCRLAGLPLALRTSAIARYFSPALRRRAISLRSSARAILIRPLVMT